MALVDHEDAKRLKFSLVNISCQWRVLEVMGRHTWLGNQLVQKGDPFYASTYIRKASRQP